MKTAKAVSPARAFSATSYTDGWHREALTCATGAVWGLSQIERRTGGLSVPAGLRALKGSGRPHYFRCGSIPNNRHAGSSVQCWSDGRGVVEQATGRYSPPMDRRALMQSRFRRVGPNDKIFVERSPIGRLVPDAACRSAALHYGGAPTREAGVDRARR